MICVMTRIAPLMRDLIGLLRVSPMVIRVRVGRAPRSIGGRRVMVPLIGGRMVRAGAMAGDSRIRGRDCGPARARTCGMRRDRDGGGPLMVGRSGARRTRVRSFWAGRPISTAAAIRRRPK